MITQNYAKVQKAEKKERRSTLNRPLLAGFFKAGPLVALSTRV